MSTRTTPFPKIGDTVTIGKGKKHWTVIDYWPDQPLVTLQPIDGYTRTTVHTHRIHTVKDETNE